LSAGMKDVYTKPIMKKNLEEMLFRLNSGEFQRKPQYILSPDFHCENLDLENHRLI